MVASCHIVLQPPADGFFRPGDEITGSVVYSLTDETEFKDIILVLVGRGICVWREHLLSIIVKDATYKGCHKIVKKQISLLDPKNSPSNKVQVGAYEHNFNVQLPKNIPSTYFDRYCSVRYYVKVKFIKAGLFHSKEKYQTEALVRDLFEDDPEYGKKSIELEKTIFRLFERKNNKINVKVDFLKCLLQPGEKMTTIVEIFNTTNLVLPSAFQFVFRKVVYRSDSGKKKIVYQLIAEECLGKVSENSFEKFKTEIPITDKFQTIRNSNVLSVIFYQKIYIQLPVPHKKIVIRIPFIIGDVRNKDPVAEASIKAEEDKSEDEEEKTNDNDLTIEVDDEAFMLVEEIKQCL